MEPVEATATPHTPHTREHRRSCSCGLVILTLLFFLLAAVVATFLLYKRYLEEQVFHGWTPADRHAFEQWSSTPLDIPPDFLELRKPPPPAFATRRTKAFEDSLNVRMHQDTFREISSDIGHRLLAGQSMSTTETKAVGAFVRYVKPNFEEVAHVAASPHFVSNLRTPLGSDYDPNHVFAIRLSKDYTRAATYLGDTAAATDALSTTLLLFRCDPEAEIQFQALDQVLVTTLYLYELTTNSLALTDILHSLNNARRYFYNFELPLGFSQTIQLNMVHQMVENGFIRKMPPTWAELYQIAFYFQDYLNWLKRKLPANDPRVAQADEMLAKGGGLLPPLRYLNVFPVSLTKPYIYQLLFTKYGLQRLTFLYRELPYDHERVRRVGARYDLARLAFARRIASLNGQPVPIAPEDFVSRYMPAFPTDPFTSAPMQFSETRQAFFSAGPDAVSHTPDDIYFLDTAAADDSRPTMFIPLND